MHVAEIAQLVEHNLAKVGVGSSSLLFRSNSIFTSLNWHIEIQDGVIAKRLCTGLQIHVARFDSGSRLHPQDQNDLLAQANIRCPGGGIGRHRGLKIPRQQCCAGSSPAPGTIPIYIRSEEHTSELQSPR